MRKFFLLTLSFLLAFGSSAAIADKSVARVKTLAGAVALERGGETSAIALGESIYESDVIKTGPNGSTGLLFNDDSRVGIGPESVFELTEYQFDDIGDRGNADFTIRSGTLAGISGKMVKRTPESLVVRTPTAIIAVRGTEFGIKVSAPADQ